MPDSRKSVAEKVHEEIIAAGLVRPVEDNGILVWAANTIEVLEAILYKHLHELNVESLARHIDLQ